MNKPNKCKNCQWYGKPYWSIINPCDNCPRESYNMTSDMSIGKVVVNGVEVTDVESWNKAIQTFSELEYQIKEKDKEIEILQNIIKEVREYIEKNWDFWDKENGNYISNKKVLEILDKEAT